MATIAVIDYGMGNLRSVAKSLEHVAPESRIVVTSDPQVINDADRIVFPGQGAMPDCIREIDARGLREPLVSAAQCKPFLGLCIGLQMLFEHSAEGDVNALGILPGRVLRFPSARMQDAKGRKLKVPHMGWNQVWQKKTHPMWVGIEDGSRFYFVHSYFVDTGESDMIAGESSYPFTFTCAVAQDNIFAVQFHPEKSQSAGLKLLSNFVSWSGSSSALSNSASTTASV